MGVCIIGGNCVGLYTALKLAEKGIQSLVVEEHAKIGLPLKCTGLVSDNINNYIKIDEFVLNRVSCARFFFGDSGPYEFNGAANVIDRTAFDRSIYERCISSGVKFMLKTKYRDFSRSHNVEVKTDNGEVIGDFLVGADGAGSLVGRKIGITNKIIPAMQVRAKGRFDETAVELHFSKDWPDFFAWVAPESSTVARIGVGAGANLDVAMDSFLKKKRVKNIIDRQAGMIPVDYHEHFCDERVALVGDAASHVKATTGGGIVTGLGSAKILSRAIKKVLDTRNFSKEFLQQEYEEPCIKEWGAELKKAFMVHKIMNVLGKDDYTDVQKLLSNAMFKNTLEKNVDMEEYSRFLSKCAMTPAGILFGAKTILKNPSLLKDLFDYF